LDQKVNSEHQKADLNSLENSALRSFRLLIFHCLAFALLSGCRFPVISMAFLSSFLLPLRATHFISKDIAVPFPIGVDIPYLDSVTDQI
jgi:hypothetical protein